MKSYDKCKHHDIYFEFEDLGPGITSQYCPECRKERSQICLLSNTKKVDANIFRDTCLYNFEKGHE